MEEETHKYQKRTVLEDVPDSLCPAGQQEQEFRAQWKRDWGRTERIGVFLKHTVVVSGGDAFAKDCPSGSERGLSISALFKGSLVLLRPP